MRTADAQQERGLLQRLANGPVSGDTLAREAGLTRAAVWKRIDALREAGVTALKIEGRQRGKAYVAEVVSTLKKALKAAPQERASLLARLETLSEGGKTTTGAYEKRWR